MVKGKNQKRAGANVSNIVMGSIFKPSESPPVITLSPFHRTIVRLRNSGAGWTVKLSELATAVASQAGLEGATFKANEGLEIKLHSLSIWAVAGYPNDLIVVVRDPTVDQKVSTATELVRIDSMAMQNQFARAGYRYPSHIASRVLHSILEKDRELFTCQANLGGFEAHVTVSWRGSCLKFLQQYTNVPLPLGGGSSFVNVEDDVSVKSCDLDLAIEDAELKLRLLELKKQKKLNSD